MKLFRNRTTNHVSDWMLWRWMEIKRVDGDAYMTRLYVVNTPLFGIKLHWFWGSDPEDCHDHPWWFISVLLRGWYIEKRERLAEPHHTFEPEAGCEVHREKRWYLTRSTGSVAFRRARDIHSIVNVQHGTLTLVLNGPARRGWGFWKSTSSEDPRKVCFVDWRTFLGLPPKTPGV